MRTNHFSKIALISLCILALCAFPACAQDSSNVTKVGQIENLDRQEAVDVSGNCAYVTSIAWPSQQSTFYVINIANETLPYIIGSCVVPSWEASKVLVSGDYAFVPSGYEGLYILDISVDSLPEIVSQFDTSGEAVDIAIVNNLAYIAWWGQGLYVLDISDPINPTYVANFDSIGAYSGIAISGNYAFISLEIQSPQFHNGLQVIDISNPANPSPVNLLEFSSVDANPDIAIYGNYAYVAVGDSGLKIIDVSNPYIPIEIANFIPGIINNIKIEGDHAYATGYQQFWILDISNPTNPIIVGFYSHYPDEIWFYDLAVSGSYAYAAEDSFFSIYNCSEAQPVNPFTEIEKPMTYSLSSPYPNPFNPTTMLTFTLPHPAKVTLEVFDINGRRVGAHCVRPDGGGGALQGARSAPLQEVWYEAGTHTIPFDGSGLPSGIYLARLTAGEYTAVQKMVLLK